MDARFEAGGKYDPAQFVPGLRKMLRPDLSALLCDEQIVEIIRGAYTQRAAAAKLCAALAPTPAPRVSELVVVKPAPSGPLHADCPSCVWKFEHPDSLPEPAHDPSPLCRASRRPHCTCRACW